MVMQLSKMHADATVKAKQDSISIPRHKMTANQVQYNGWMFVVSIKGAPVPLRRSEQQAWHHEAVCCPAAQRQAR
jgi:hypothetical protein